MMIPSKEYRKFLYDAKKTLVACYDYSRHSSDMPDEAAELLVDSIGAMSAAEIISALILVKGKFDGRISKANMEWAAETCQYEAEDLNLIPDFWYCDEIHPSHFDRIASCIRRTIHMSERRAHNA